MYVILVIYTVGVGLFFYLLEKDEDWTRTHLSWLPLVAVMTFMVGFSMGYGPVPWIIMGMHPITV